MRILIIPSADLSYNSGSVIYAKKLFMYLVDSGHDVYTLGNCLPNDMSQKYISNIIVKSNLLFHPIIDDRFVSNEMYFYMLKDILDAVDYIKQKFGKIDIIHAHYSSINSYAAMIAYDLLDIPFVVSSFGRDLSIGYNYSEKLRNFIIKSYLSTKKIIVPDDEIKRMAIEKTNVDIKGKIIKIPMPIDGNVFKYNNEDVLSYKKDKKIVISSINSCFTQEKGIEVILKAVKNVLEKHDVFLYIAGDDDDEQKVNYEKLKKMVETLKIKDNVSFLGYIERKKVGALLNASDIFVDARTKGHFSSVLLEAQFFDTVTISADNDSAYKIITDNNGIFFKQGNCNDLTDKINMVIENQNLVSLIKTKRENWVKEYGKEFKEDICFEKVEKVYLECLNS